MVSPRIRRPDSRCRVIDSEQTQEAHSICYEPLAFAERTGFELVFQVRGGHNKQQPEGMAVVYRLRLGICSDGRHHRGCEPHFFSLDIDRNGDVLIENAALYVGFAEKSHKPTTESPMTV